MTITARIDAITGIPESRRRPVLPAPKSVKVSLDDNCQFKCSFCSSRLQPTKAQMPWEMYTRLVDELVAEGVEELGTFFIGEPMLAKDLVRAVAYAKGAGIKYVFLTTNGHLATPKRVQALMEAGLDSLKFSFNYAGSEQLEEVAHVPGRVFDMMVDNIRQAAHVKTVGNYACNIYASSILFDGEQGERMKAAVKTILPYVTEHYWLPCFSFGGQANFGQTVRGNPGRLGAMRDLSQGCWSVFQEGHVTASGKVSMCCFDSHERWVVGDLREVTFMQAWNSEKAQALRRAHLEQRLEGTECEFCAVGT